MLAKRIIPCLDVKDGKVIKGTNFKNHRIVGEITDLAKRYSDEGADELVFYDITASSENRYVDKKWIEKVASQINIPFSVAGGIRTIEQAKIILNYGADKISINSPAIENPDLINQLADIFGSQCVVIGIDTKDGFIYQYTGDESKTKEVKCDVFQWAKEVESRGAGEIVLNSINKDGVKTGYDIPLLQKLRQIVNIPIIASGGAGSPQHFSDVFLRANVDGALAASVFHNQEINIKSLKEFLQKQNITVRL